MNIGYNNRFKKLKELIRGGSSIPTPPDPVDPVDPTPPPSSGDNYREEIEAFIDDASKSPGGTAVFPWENKVLRVVPKTPDGRHMKWEGLTDKIIDMNGCTIVASEASLILRLDRLDGVTIRNGNFIGFGDLASTGVWDAKNKRFLVDEGMPTGSNIYTVGNIPAPYTSGPLAENQIYKEVFVQDMTLHRGDATKYGTYKLEGRAWVHQSGEVPDFKDGEKVLLQLFNNHGHAIVPNNEEYIKDLTFENLTFTNIPGMCISGETDGNTTFRNIKTKLKAGAKLSLASDGLHLDNSRNGVLIEDCDMRFINDDFINCNAKWARVVSVTGNDVTVSKAVAGDINIGKFCDSGEDIVFCASSGNRGDKPTDGGEAFVQTSTSRSTEKAKSHTFTLKSATGVKPGMLVVNRDRTTSNVVVRDSMFEGTRATGFKARSSNTLVQNCIFRNCYGTAIRSDHFTERGEGVFPHNIVIDGVNVVGSGRRDDITQAGKQPVPFFWEAEVEGVTVK